MWKMTLMAAIAGLALQPALAQDQAMTDETRKVAVSLLTKLAGALQAEMGKGGPEAAIGVCRDIAPQAAGELSRQNGWRVSRVSLKVRNPLLGTPDAWESAALMDFEKRAAAGEELAKLEKGEVVKEGDRQYFRYIKAIPTQEVCLNCHGAADKIQPNVKAKLTAEYPHDQATGYSAGQIRGGVSVKRPI